MEHEHLTDRVDELYRKFMNAYTKNMGGFYMSVADCQYACDELYEIREAVAALERKVPPPAPEVKGENVVSLSEFLAKNTTKRRI